jgi:hypothetical protein
MVSLMPLTPRATSWGAWPIGLQKARTGEMEEGAGNSIIGIIGVIIAVRIVPYKI